MSIFETINKISLKQKRGMWLNIAKENGVSAKELQNYYHNTFIKQFFVSPQPFKEEITQILMKSDQQSTEEIFNQFIQKHPDVKFNQRLTKQFIGILRIRNGQVNNQKKKPKENKTWSDSWKQ